VAARRAGKKQVHPDLDRLPRRLSPSRASDFKQCPKKFEYVTLDHLSSPPSMATTRGSLAHEAFERIFDHEAGTRTPDLACTYILPAWAKLRDASVTDPDPERQARLRERAGGYADLAPAGSVAEKELLTTTEAVVRSWFDMERVNNFTPPLIDLADGTTMDGREAHVTADLFASTTGLNLHGYIDRLDRWVNPQGETVWAIGDYKTGKVPTAGKNYPKATMDRILHESFFQLRVYALLCKEMLDIDVKYLRLIYVATGDKTNGIKTSLVTPAVLEATRREVATIWADIVKAATAGVWKTKTGPLCPYCFFIDICPAFNPAMEGVKVTDRP